jgi:hypothetical protein
MVNRKCMEKNIQKENSEIMVTTINKLTGILFKIEIIRKNSGYNFNYQNEIEETEYTSYEYYYRGKTDSHDFYLTISISDNKYEYKITYGPRYSTRVKTEFYETELELCVFLKQSKFHKKFKD